MAFCTGCGATLDDTARFCTACGTHVPEAATSGAQASAPAGPAMSSAAPAAARPSQPSTIPPVASPGGGGGVVKAIVIVLVIIVGLAILSFAGLFWGLHKLRKAVHVEQNREQATVTTPWGKVSSNKDSAEVARAMNVDIYPGAKSLPGGNAVSFAGSTVGTAEFESSDPIEKVGKFYTSRYPKSTINTADENNQTILASTNSGMITIVLENHGDGTKITISRIAGGAEKNNNGNPTE